MHDLRCADPDEMHYTELRNKARYFKQTEEGVAEMSAVFEAIVEQERAKSFTEGEADGVRKVARNLITSGMPIPEIAKNTNLSVDEVNNLRKSMSL